MRNCDERKPRQQTQDTNYWKSQITKLTRRQSKPTESEMLQNYCQMVASHPGLSVNIMLESLLMYSKQPRHESPVMTTQTPSLMMLVHMQPAHKEKMEALRLRRPCAAEPC